MNATSKKDRLLRRLGAAQGRIPCDVVFKDVEFLDVFQCAWRRGDVAVYDGIIVGIEPGLRATRTIDGKGKTLVPGFIDAHVHIESSMMMPVDFERVVLECGTTSAICDPHELTNVMGTAGLEYFLTAAAAAQMDLRIMLSSCVPATDFETNGGGHVLADALVGLRGHPKALGLAEVMNVPGVIGGSDEVIDKVVAFSDGIMDGHCPLLSGQGLSAYALTGISSCHESTQLEEAREKLTKGMSVWIREGSVAKDLRTLVPLLNAASSPSIGFCTDDRNPLDIATEGHIDHLVRGAIASGVASEVAYRSASWSVARHYQMRHKGAIAPGYEADLVLLADKATCAVEKVFRAGVATDELTFAKEIDRKFVNSIRAKAPQAVNLEAPAGLAHVIGVLEGKIITEHLVKDSSERGVRRLSVLERYGKGSRPANAYASGFGENFHGAIASSVGHDSHNLIVVGEKSSDMQVALNALAACGGGFCVVQDGNVLAQLPLAFGGLMSTEGPESLQKGLKRLREASRATGCALPEPFLQLAFLSLPVIPSLKLTDRGLVDVDKFTFIDVKGT